MNRPLIIHTAWARYIHLNQGVRWLISDDAANTNSDAYDMYVLSKCIRHKLQVKYISEVETLDGMLYKYIKFWQHTGSAAQRHSLALDIALALALGVDVAFRAGVVRF